MDSDELLYGPIELNQASNQLFHAQVAEGLADAARRREMRELAGIRHEGENEFGNRVVFWTRDRLPGITFKEAAECAQIHREDGPAASHDLPGGGTVRSWYQDGLRHREDGPAIEGRPDQPDEYWFRGAPLTEDEWQEHFGTGP